MSWSVVLPHEAHPSLREAMAKVCDVIVEWCRASGVSNVERVCEAGAGGPITICLAEPSPYAVMAGGRKLAGLSARRYRSTWLIQGSLLNRPWPERLRRRLPPAVRQAIDDRAVSLTEASGIEHDEGVAARMLAEVLRA